MVSINTPYLYCRNGIYYYCNQSTWKFLKTRCKKEEFRKLSINLFGTTPAVSDTSFRPEDASVTRIDTKPTPNNTLPSTSELIKAYLAENGNRWCAKEYTRINSPLGFLPKGVIT